jgi:hypothetical protein
MDNSFEQPITIVALIALGYVCCKAMSSKRNGKRRVMRGGMTTGSKIAGYLFLSAIACFGVGIGVCGFLGACDMAGFMIAAAVLGVCAFILGMSGA